MGLADDRRKFTRYQSVLIAYGNELDGLAVRSDMVKRTAEEQARLVKIGASLTMLSGHLNGVAVDLIVDKLDGDGVYQWSTNGQDYMALGWFWKSLNPKCVWGGDWDRLRDYGHFELGLS